MISAQNLCKQYGETPVLNNISLEIAHNEVVGLVGLSGSGKSTLLKCLHGLEAINEGQLNRQGNTGVIFQQFHLFPHMNVLENITYAPLKALKKMNEEVNAKANNLLARMGLSDKHNAYPHQLSGGQKQRVAIVRALMMEPQILLLDEPTSALDPLLVQEVVTVVQELKNQGLTLVIASHELAFLKQVADRILFMEKGNLLHDKIAAQFFQELSLYFPTDY